ncbi:hypothetical protein ACA910_007997 [Epithemia clementina (nom. ined.)]
MKFVALVSGGKDSYFAIQQALDVGHELVACLHMARPPPPPPTSQTKTKDESNKSDDEEQPDEESYMYQSAGSEVVRKQVEECLQVPYFEYTRQGTSQQTSLVYQPQQTDVQEQQQEGSNRSQQQQPPALHRSHDEVEDLYHALQWVLQTCRLSLNMEIQAVSSGAILSTYQRLRVEYVVCQQLQLTSLAYLWRWSTSQRALLHSMLTSGLEAVVVRTAAPPGLVPQQHLGKPLSKLLPLLDKLYDQYQFHVCGEGGEYETLCVDSPLFHQRLVLDQVQIELDDDHDDTVGNLRILQCHTETKTTTTASSCYADKNNMASLATATSKPFDPPPPSLLQNANKVESNHHASPPAVSWPPDNFTSLPSVKCVPGGLLHISEITSPILVSSSSPPPPPPHDDMDSQDKDENEARLVVQEALQVFAILNKTLQQHSCTPHDVVMVHLYLSQMSHFARINQHYQAFFGTFLPPSRSCIATTTTTNSSPSSTRGPRVVLDCLVQRNSGRAMRAANPSSSRFSQLPPQRRQVLHVQSRSFWAPVCVGPYSQANTLWSALHYLAGQIGLNPSTMTLVTASKDNERNDPTATLPFPATTATVEKNWMGQLQLSWRNLAQVLDALDQGSLLDNILSCLIYIPQTVWNSEEEHNNNHAGGSAKNALLSMLQEICQSSLEDNGGVVPGLVDKGEIVFKANNKNEFDGYEDEETMREVMMGSSFASSAMQQSTLNESTTKLSFPAILVVAVAELPVGAEIEVEVVAATQQAAQCLGRTIRHHPAVVVEPRREERIASRSRPATIWKWDTGQNDDDDDNNAGGSSSSSSSAATKIAPEPRHNNKSEKNQNDPLLAMSISCHMCTLGRDCAGYAIVTASVPPESLPMHSYADDILETMMEVLEQNLPEFSMENLLHIRMNYLLAGSSLDQLRSALAVVLATRTIQPAVTWVPVHDMDVLLFPNGNNTIHNSSQMFLAMQATFIEPTNIETELWIRSPR